MDRPLFDRIGPVSMLQSPAFAAFVTRTRERHHIIVALPDDTVLIPTKDHFSNNTSSTASLRCSELLHTCCKHNMSDRHPSRSRSPAKSPQELQDDIDHWYNEAVESHEEVDKVQRKLFEVQSACKNAEVSKQELQAKYNKLYSQYKDLQHGYRHLESKAEKAVKDAQEAEGAFAQASDEAKAALKRARDETEKSKALEGDLAGLQASFDEKQTEISALKQTISTLAEKSSENDHLTTKLNNCQKILSKIFAGPIPSHEDKNWLSFIQAKAELARLDQSNLLSAPNSAAELHFPADARALGKTVMPADSAVEPQVLTDRLALDKVNAALEESKVREANLQEKIRTLQEGNRELCLDVLDSSSHTVEGIMRGKSLGDELGGLSDEESEDNGHDSDFEHQHETAVGHNLDEQLDIVSEKKPANTLAQDLEEVSKGSSATDLVMKATDKKTATLIEQDEHLAIVRQLHEEASRWCTAHDELSVEVSKLRKQAEGLRKENAQLHEFSVAKPPYASTGTSTEHFIYTQDAVELEQYRDQVNALREELSSVRREYEQLNVECIDMEKSNENLRLEIFNLKERVATSQKNVRKATNTFQTLHLANITLQQEKTKLQQETTQLQAASNDSNLQIQKLHNQNAEIQANNKALHEAFDELRECGNGLRDGLEASMARNRAQTKELQRQREENSALKEETASRRAANKALKKKMATVSKENDALRKKHHKVREMLTKERGNLEEARDTLIPSLTGQLELYSDMLNTMSKMLAKVRELSTSTALLTARNTRGVRAIARPDSLVKTSRDVSCLNIAEEETPVVEAEIRRIIDSMNRLLKAIYIKFLVWYVLVVMLIWIFNHIYRVLQEDVGQLRPMR
ncbi:hypothetical protein K470DRAFT_254889 [Piedraia hortae CBS 480.64]|uniref:Uncharacterized protein n=1 Tax=Piedraia hortae CBS 480.64 TaxID=1314780 RepID=A0A6A7CAF9_9PEZI|nr:hypothetical protein K470DRAFT_254889 [Piedraia hortae CBS 480.64]